MTKEEELFGFTGTTDNLLPSDLSTVELSLKKYIVDSGNINQNFSKTSYNNWRLAALVYRLYHLHDLHKLEFYMESAALDMKISNVFIEMDTKRLEYHKNQSEPDAEYISKITDELTSSQREFDKASQEYFTMQEKYKKNFELYKESLAKFIHFDENGSFIDDIDQNKELQTLFNPMKGKSSREDIVEETPAKPDSYSLRLISYNTSLIGAIKVYKKLIGGDLKAATETIKSAPCTLFDNLDKQTATSYMAEFKVECPDVEIVIEPN